MLDEDACDVAGVVAVTVIGVDSTNGVYRTVLSLFGWDSVDRTEASGKRKMGKRVYPQPEGGMMNNQSQGNGRPD